VHVASESESELSASDHVTSSARPILHSRISYFTLALLSNDAHSHPCARCRPHRNNSVKGLRFRLALSLFPLDSPHGSVLVYNPPHLASAKQAIIDHSFLPFAFVCLCLKPLTLVTIFPYAFSTFRERGLCSLHVPFSNSPSCPPMCISALARHR